MVCLALELVGPWVVLGFSVGMEAFAFASAEPSIGVKISFKYIFLK